MGDDIMVRDEVAKELSSEEIIRENTKNILSYLLKRSRLGITQENIAKELHCTQPTISKYTSGKETPRLDFLLYLNKKYHFSLDLLISRVLTENDIILNLRQESQGISFPKEYDDLKKYCGLYFTYYFFNGDPVFDGKAGDNLLDYGLIDIYECDSPSAYELEARAIMGIHSQNELIHLHKQILGNSNKGIPSIMEESFSQLSSKHLYKGKLHFPEESKSYFSISLSRGGDDAFLLFHRPSLESRTRYLGGLGTINSISKKRFLPCIQNIALSINNLSSVPPEEIASYLHMTESHLPDIDAHSIFHFIDKLYHIADLRSDDLSTIFENFLQHRVNHFLSEQILRFHQIDKEDRNWYELIKTFLAKETHHAKEE